MLHMLFRWHEKNDPKIFLCYIFIKLFVYVRIMWEQLFKIKGIFSAKAFALFHYFFPYSLRLLSALRELSVWPDSNFSCRMSYSLWRWDTSFLCILGLSPVKNITVKNYLLVIYSAWSILLIIFWSCQTLIILKNLHPSSHLLSRWQKSLLYSLFLKQALFPFWISYVYQSILYIYLLVGFCWMQVTEISFKLI